MSEHRLHDLVAAYRAQNGEQKTDKETIFGHIASLVYSSHAALGFDDEDAASDALIKYKSRITRLVDRFQDRGLPFDAYLATSLRFLAKTVRRERRREAERRFICERAAMDDYAESWAREEQRGGTSSAEGYSAMQPGVCDPLRSHNMKQTESVSFGGKCTTSKRRPRAKGGRLPRRDMQSVRSSRLVFLAVKCAWELDDESVGRIAETAGVPRDWLTQAVGQARRSLEPERLRYERIIERRNSSWCRCRLLETRLEQENDPPTRAKLKFSLERERRRLKKAREELSALKPIVPNAVVARILGVPKGTVDSGLYYLRKQQQKACPRKQSRHAAARVRTRCREP